MNCIRKQVRPVTLSLNGYSTTHRPNYEILMARSAGQAMHPDAALGFLDYLKGISVNDITLGGRDPLAYPHLPELVARIKAKGLNVTLDMVGVPRLGDAHRFYPSALGGASVPLSAFQHTLHRLALSLDGADHTTDSAFRIGGRCGVQEALATLDATEKLGIPVQITTVVNAYNRNGLSSIARTLTRFRHIAEWCIEPLAPLSPSGYLRTHPHALTSAQFHEAVSDCLRTLPTSLDATWVNVRRFDPHTLYLMVECDGTAWTPRPTRMVNSQPEYEDETPDRIILGNIFWQSDLDYILRFTQFETYWGTYCCSA